jgi:hypothetical protein
MHADIKAQVESSKRRKERKRPYIIPKSSQLISWFSFSLVEAR